MPSPSSGKTSNGSTIVQPSRAQWLWASPCVSLHTSACQLIMPVPQTGKSGSFVRSLNAILISGLYWSTIQDVTKDGRTARVGKAADGRWWTILQQIQEQLQCNTWTSAFSDEHLQLLLIHFEQSRVASPSQPPYMTPQMWQWQCFSSANVVV